jgi:hypothetical protein
MSYVDAAGVKLYLEETGQGYPIILVQKVGSDLRAWEDQVRHSCRVDSGITFNICGYPLSDVPEGAALYPSAEFTTVSGSAIAEPLRTCGAQQ